MTSNHGNNDDDDDRKDLTHIGELPEFLHVDDTDIDLQFSKSSNQLADEGTTSDSLIDLDDLDSEQNDDVLPSIPFESEDETEFSLDTETETETEVESVFEEETNFKSDIDTELEPETFFDSPVEEFSPMETNFFDEPATSFATLDSDEESETDFFTEPETKDEMPFQARENFNLTQEKFEDVKNFAQNFSYGTIEGAGNPPFTIIARNIASSDDADDIKILLKEFGIINDNNLTDFENALAIGSIIIPQISEFTAIVLAHKLRRFDLDLEVGLSDEIHPSKSGEINPRGLTKKNHINQNKEESFKRIEQIMSINDLIISTTNTIEGYQISQYLGVLHTHTFIDEEELDRLNFINKNLRTSEISTEDQSIYEKYKKSFNKIHDDLLNELKSIAFKDGANALLGVHFSMTPLHDNKKNQYQISCSCTKAVASRQS